MPKFATAIPNADLLAAALEGLELRKKQIEDQISTVQAMMGGHQPTAARAARLPESEAGAAPRTGRRKMNAAARKRIAAAQKKRWAEFRRQKAAGQ